MGGWFFLLVPMVSTTDTEVAKLLAADRIVRLVANLALLGVLCLIYAAVFLLSNRLFYGLGRETVFVALSYVLVSAALRFWSGRWWMAAVPALPGYLMGSGALSWAIHLTDTRGEYAPPMRHYIFSPSRSDVVSAVVVTGAAAIGWFLANYLIRAVRSPRE